MFRLNFLPQRTLRRTYPRLEARENTEKNKLTKIKALRPPRFSLCDLCGKTFNCLANKQRELLILFDD